MTLGFVGLLLGSRRDVRDRLLTWAISKFLRIPEDLYCPAVEGEHRDF